MAGHSHWAGIKHKKGKADKQRSKIFSKLSKEITVAAKLGDKDPSINPRLRSAIQAARSANMPKDNIERAIDKSSVNTELNFENLRYEGFGPDKVAVIVEALTDNKNRTASNIRTIFQKSGGNLGTQGSASHNFNQLGIIKIDKKEISDEEIFDLSMALSILSLGIFADLAAWIADLNLGFIAGSLSPSFAATVISFDNFEKILDLCLSALPFLCLIPAQWECPAIYLVSIF